MGHLTVEVDPYWTVTLGLQVGTGPDGDHTPDGATHVLSAQPQTQCDFPRIVDCAVGMGNN